MIKFKVVGGSGKRPQFDIVAARIVEIPGYEDFMFVLHKPARKDLPHTYFISEYSTGRKVGEGVTEEYAILWAKAVLDEKGGPEAVRKKIEERIRQYGMVNDETRDRGAKKDKGEKP